LFNLSVVQAYAHAPGGATGITQTGTYLGAGLGPMLFGVVADHLGFGWAWPISATWLLAGALAMVVGRRLLADHVAARA
jgi:MFS family permease